ncbi:pilus assembly FimT family protein [Geotalea toluenoxydans]|uniref:pilus assembly FimT family protein n=1 Tax=Geotalea toluenoxydans TaxID=421624 RepID=UPI0006D0A9FE|nr:prepilin-type N-terminal cleavage/methylation domain-containing protein [Geotalea toluenoxydans]
MQRERGFSLVELLVVMAIMATLLAIATHNWNQMTLKSGVESQIKKMQADLMEVRLQALYSKNPRSVVITGKQFKIYASDDTTATPITTKDLPYSVVWNDDDSSPVIFDAQGLTRGLTPDTKRYLCILPTNDTAVVNAAAVDSMAISQVRVNLGKRTGGGCAGANIKQQ